MHKEHRSPTRSCFSYFKNHKIFDDCFRSCIISLADFNTSHLLNLHCFADEYSQCKYVLFLRKYTNRVSYFFQRAKIRFSFLFARISPTKSPRNNKNIGLSRHHGNVKLPKRSSGLCFDLKFSNKLYELIRLLRDNTIAEEDASISGKSYTIQFTKRVTPFGKKREAKRCGCFPNLRAEEHLFNPSHLATLMEFKTFNRTLVTISLPRSPPT